ncbi:MAG: hypothetical protein WA885_06840 [Phormidesmis sp.]
MVKASDQIEQELASLQQKTETMADALEPLYDAYIKALSKAGERQLMLAVYHLCTQVYPDKFLALSWDQRNRLQQALQALSAQIYEQLMVQRDRAKKASRQPQQHNGLAFLQRLLESRATGATVISQPDEGDIAEALSALARSRSDQRPQEPLDRLESPPSESAPQEADDFEDWEDGIDSFADDSFTDNSFTDDSPQADIRQRFDDEDLNAMATEADEPADGASEGGSRQSSEDDSLEDDRSKDDELDYEMEVPPADQRLTLSDEEDLLAAIEGLARRSVQDHAATDEAEKPLAPIHLVKQQVLLEKAVRDVFAMVSEGANELLQKADVMPNFPKALMAAATDSQGMGEPLNSVPNVVKVSVRVMHGEAMMEPDEEEDSEDERPEGRTEGDRNARRRSRRFRRESAAARRPSRREISRRMMNREFMEIEALPELAAISLRLSEVEFTDPTVSAWRSRLRQKLNELKKLGTRYKKTQRALETARAEDAWRSSWTVRQPDDP